MKLRRKLRLFFVGKTFFYIPLARLFSTGEVASTKTELVIEGFPRSGNSFFEAAVRLATAERLELAHHCHAAAHVKYARKKRIPCVFLVREPVDACVSLMMHHDGYFSEVSVLEEYILLHRQLLSMLDEIIVVNFNVAINDYNKVSSALSNNFGVDIGCYNDYLGSSGEIFKKVDELSRARGTVNEGVEPYSPFASASERLKRKEKKKFIKEKFKSQELEGLLSEANSLYEMYNSRSVR